MKRFVIHALLVLSMLLNIGLAMWIVHSLTNYTEYCYEHGTQHVVQSLNDSNNSQYGGPINWTCQDSPLPQTP